MTTIAERYGTDLRCYDNGGKTRDRYTILPPRWAKDYMDARRRLWSGIGASESPFHPQGFGMLIEAQAGPHLGRRVSWDALPADVQRFATQYFSGYAPKDGAA